MVAFDTAANSAGRGRFPDGLEYTAAGGADPPPQINGRAGRAPYDAAISVLFAGNCSSNETLLERNFLSFSHYLFTDPHRLGPLELVALRGRHILYDYVNDVHHQPHTFDIYTGVFT